MLDYSDKICENVREASEFSDALTLHDSHRIFQLRFEQVDSHHSCQVFYVHLIHIGVLLHLK